MMKVYISGPITGTDDYMERFAAAEQSLREQNYDVVNPAKENADLPVGTSWQTYMGESLRLLCGCDAIYMLDGWHTSRGATLEYIVAGWLKLKEIKLGTCNLEKDVLS